MEKNPFPELKIKSPFFLNGIKGRSLCPKCGKSRKFYCYSCYVPLGGPEFESQIPNIKLPVKIDIIKHPQEVDGKSTAVHAGILCPDDVTIYTYPTIPEYPDKRKVLLVFPGTESVAFNDYVSSTCNKVLTTTNQELQCTTNSDIIEEALAEANKHLPETNCSDSKTDSAKLPDSCVESAKENCSSIDDVHKQGDSGESDGSYFGKQQSDCNTASLSIDTEGDREGRKERTDLLQNVKQRCIKRDHNVSESEPPIKKLKPTDEGAFEKKAKFQAAFDRVVFIDSTWHTVNKISQDERLAGIQRIELKLQKTKFWRYQLDKPDTYLSTIEAVYYFLREYHTYFDEEAYIGQFDNLLFYFVFQYDKIRMMYEGGKKLKAYTNNTTQS